MTKDDILAYLDDKIMLTTEVGKIEKELTNKQENLERELSKEPYIAGKEDFPSKFYKYEYILEIKELIKTNQAFTRIYCKNFKNFSSCQC